MRTFLMVLAIITMASPAVCQEPPQTPVETLIRCQIAGGIVPMTIAVFVAEGNMTHAAESDEAFRKGLVCLDENVKEAVNFVGQNADARNAVKDFYAKASAYLNAAKPMPGEGRRAYDARKQDPARVLDEARAKLRLEMKLIPSPA